jgi:F-type H+-transporting ATPase subunit b
MDGVISIFGSLGVNETLVYQFVVFVFVFIFMKQFVFEPYFKAFMARQDQTTGSQTEAEQLIAKSRELETIYQRKARTLNTDIKAAFDKELAKAHVEQDKIIVEAKEKAKKALDEAFSVIHQERAKAREELLKESKQMGEAVAAQLLTK